MGRFFCGASEYSTYNSDDGQLPDTVMIDRGG